MSVNHKIDLFPKVKIVSFQFISSHFAGVFSSNEAFVTNFSYFPLAKDLNALDR